MRDNHSRQRAQLRSITLIVLTLLLSGCADKPQKETTESAAPLPKERELVQEQVNSLALPPSSHSAVFASAEQALAKFDWMQASVILQALPVSALTGEDATYLGYLQARIDYIRGDQVRAQQQLEQLQTPRINPTLRYRILSFKHHMLEMQGDTLAAAQLADQILRSAPRDTAAGWKRSVWRNLERTDEDQLVAALPLATDPQWRGWIDLALRSRQDDATLVDQLSRWRSDHPDHPAANPLPGGLDYLVTAGPQRGKVALLLPLSGELAPAGKAVLNGFLAAYYADRAAGGAASELLVMDMDTFPSASDAYDKAVQQQVGLVIGPLNKESLADLATRLERPIPILALNRIDQVLPAAGSALVQLSLSPEDEAAAVADLAFGAGKRRALIIHPTGEWGTKMDTALRARWTALGGTVTSNAAYTTYDDYSNSINSALAVDASEHRARDLSSAMGTKIEFTPRRRQDPDVIFLLSRSQAEARSIKPLLAFHYAGDLPVYATSSVYSGIPDERNQDLNGIRLVETPWVLDSNPELRATLAAANPGDAGYTRLNALGADAFLVRSGFARLQSGPDALFRANTGLLSMDPDLRIQREMPAATFDGGTLKAQ